MKLRKRLSDCEDNAIEDTLDMLLAIAQRDDKWKNVSEIQTINVDEEDG